MSRPIVIKRERGVISMWALYEGEYAFVGFFQSMPLAVHHMRYILDWYGRQSLPWDDFIVDFI